MTPGGWRADLRAAVPGWVAARLVVAAAWVLNGVLVAWRLDGVDPVTTRQGLYAWDGAYYREIAELGYHHIEIGAIRFHPLLPMVGTTGIGILVVANVCALLAGAAVHRLVLERLGDADLARRSATLVALAPPAFSAVWAYAEAPFLFLAALQLLALHRRRWWAAAGLGLLAALTRPSGALLAVAAAVEVARWWRESPRRLPATMKGVTGAAAAVVAPVAGVGAFLAWAERAVGDGFLPLRIQSDLRGGFVLPPFRLVEAVGELFADPLGDGLHAPFAFGMVALVWVAWRRLPGSWTALAGVAVLTNLAADNLNSIERYAYGTVPLVVALAAVVGGRWWRPGLAISVLGLAGMTTLAWYGSYVP